MMRRVEVSIPGAEEVEFVDARVTPTGSLENLAQQEVDRLLDSSRGGLYPVYRRCSLAVLNSGGETDDARAIFDRYADFELRIVRQAWGVKIELHNAPATAFVDGRMIRGIQEHLFAVLRDILYIHGEVYEHGSVELHEPQGITNAVYRVLRNAGTLLPRVRPDIVVCWGGHSIGRDEYIYTKKVGYELGLRGLNVCTGCGPGAMKGPMKGATIGHSKQRIREGRYIGLTEPGIVAAEPPNAIVNQLVIMPDIEKRLEAFVRLGHGIVVFPGGAGTAEEILYLVGILLDPKNEPQPFPVVFTGPGRSRRVFPQDRRVPGRDPRRAGSPVLPDRRRRPGGSGPRDDARHGRGPRVPPPPERRVQLQLAAAHPARDADAVRADARTDGGAEPAPGRAGAPACGRPAPRVLRHRGRQREGAGHSPDRGARPVRDPRRPGRAEAARRAAVVVRRAAAHEALGRVPALLSRRHLGLPTVTQYRTRGARSGSVRFRRKVNAMSDPKVLPAAPQEPPAPAVPADALARRSKFGAAAEGWDAYNSWLNRVRQTPGQTSRHAVISKALYSVSSYKNWADKARDAFDDKTK